MNKYTKEWCESILNNYKDKDFNKIRESQDYFIALILQSNENADIITVIKFVNIILTEFYFKLWKKHEFDNFMVQAFNEIYQKINPLKNNWPTIKEKYEDLTENINESLTTTGSEEDCVKLPELTEISVKKYIVAILNQSSNYVKNTAKTQQINRNLIDDLEKILNQPTELSILRKTVLSLQPYVYSSEKKCGNCGYCGQCIPQKFDTNSPYYVSLMRKLNELTQRMAEYEWKKSGPQGPIGPQGPQGPTGPQGPKGDTGDVADLTTSSPLVYNGKNISLSYDQNQLTVVDNNLSLLNPNLWEKVNKNGVEVTQLIDKTDIDLNLKYLKNVFTPAHDNDATNKQYVDEQLSFKANKTDLNNLETKDAHKNDINDINSKLDLKADKTSINNYYYNWKMVGGNGESTAIVTFNSDKVYKVFWGISDIMGIRPIKITEFLPVKSGDTQNFRVIDIITDDTVGVEPANLRWELQIKMPNMMRVVSTNSEYSGGSISGIYEWEGIF